MPEVEPRRGRVVQELGDVGCARGQDGTVGRRVENKVQVPGQELRRPAIRRRVDAGVVLQVRRGAEILVTDPAEDRQSREPQRFIDSDRG